MRRAATLIGAVVLFLVPSTQVAAAADGSTAGILGPFDVTGSEGVPLDHYELVSNPGGATDFQQEAQSYLMSGLFALVRVVVGVECWLIHWAYSFPLVQAVSQESQGLADDYRAYVVDTLGLPGLLLAWAVVVCSIMLMRGKAGKALGELVLTFAIIAMAGSALVRPDVILGSGGLLDQTRQASLTVAAITTNHGAAPSTTVDPADVSAPIQQTLTDTFVTEPYQLLQFGRLIPQGDKAYPAYQAAVATGPFNEDAHQDSTSVTVPTSPCKPQWFVPGDASYCAQSNKATAKDGGPVTPDCSHLQGMSLTICQNADTVTVPPQANDCSKLIGLSKSICQQAPAQGNGNTRSYTDLQNLFKTADPTVAAYIAPPSWDRVFGALLLLIAALVVGLMVLTMVGAMFAAQFADAALASCSYGALIWATLPGPSRAVLWRWVGSFVSSALVMFAAAVFLPLFDVGVAAFLQGAGPGLVPRLAMIDLLAVAGLGFHRRLLNAASAAGGRVANRLRWARIGGSGSGDDATRTGQVIAGALGLGGTGGGYTGRAGLGLLGIGGLAGSPEHAHLVRRARLLSSARALGDIPGAPLHPGRLLGDAARAAQHGLAPLTTAVRGGHHLWKGKALSPEELQARTIKPGLGGHLPLGSRLQNRLITTRGGRALLGTSRLAWAAGPGLPATWTRSRRHAQAVRRDARGQFEHYKLEGANYWHTEWKPGFRDLSTPVRVPATRVGNGAAAAGQRIHAAAPAVAATARRAAATTATAAALRTGPAAAPAARGPVRPSHSHTRVASGPDLARAEILHALVRAQREARGEDGGKK